MCPALPARPQKQAAPGMALGPPAPAQPLPGSARRSMELPGVGTRVCVCRPPPAASWAGQICPCRALSVETWAGTWDSRITCVLVGVGKRALTCQPFGLSGKFRFARPVHVQQGAKRANCLLEVVVESHLTTIKFWYWCWYLFTPFLGQRVQSSRPDSSVIFRQNQKDFYLS